MAPQNQHAATPASAPPAEARPRNRVDNVNLRLAVGSVLVAMFALGACWFGLKQAQEHLLSFEARTHAQGWAVFLREDMPHLEDILLGKPVRADDRKVIEAATQAGHIVGYKFYGPDGVVVHASRQADLGQTNTKPYFVDLVQRGELFAKVEKNPDFRGENMIVGNAYVPVMKNGKFIGAIEISVDETARADQISRFGSLVFVGLLFVLGSMGGIIALLVVRNGAQKKRTIHELRESESQIRTLVEALPVAVLVQDGTRVIFANQAAASLYHTKSVDEFIGTQLLDLIHPDERTRFAERHSIVTSGDQPLPVIEQRRICRDGTEIWVLTRGIPVIWQGRRHILGVQVDITERTRAERALGESEERLRELSDVSFDAIYEMEGQTISYISRKAIELYGYSTDELIGCDIATLVVPELRQTIGRRIKRGSQGTFETEHVRKDGSTFPAEVSAKTYVRNGVTIRAVAVRDISERKRTEQMLRDAKEAAEAASRAKSEFLATMSHEIRTPLNGILGMAGLVLETELSPTQREFTDTIQESGLALLRIISDVLDFAKMEAGKLSLEEIPFDLNEVMKTIANMTRATAEAKGLALHQEIVPGTPTWLIGDYGRLSQILLNLVSNAIKFTDSGSVDVSVRAVEESQDDVMLEFKVRDTGMGISPEDLGRLFERFTQADGSHKRAHGGTGLGLAICKQLSEMMGGTAGAESTQGKGSEFWFTAKLAVAGQALTETGVGSGAPQQAAG